MMHGRFGSRADVVVRSAAKMLSVEECPGWGS